MEIAISELERLQKALDLLRTIRESVGSSAMQVLGAIYECKVVALSKDLLTQIDEVLRCGE